MIQYPGNARGSIRCHRTGNSLVWRGQGVQVWGSGVSHGMQLLDNGVHINLGPQDWAIQGQYLTDSQNILNLPKLKTRQHEVLVRWDDFGIPTLPPSFWRLLAKRLLIARLPVLVFCQGGHGRTGTALAILLGLWGVKQPMTYVRKHYCDMAGESVAQILYLDTVLTKCGFSGQVSKKTYDDTESLASRTLMAYGLVTNPMSKYVAPPTPLSTMAKEIADAIAANAEEDAWWEERYGREYIECADGVWRRRDQVKVGIND